MHYLELSSKNVVRFDSVSQLTNVFFDDSNKQVSILRFLAHCHLIHLHISLVGLFGQKWRRHGNHSEITFKSRARH